MSNIRIATLEDVAEVKKIIDEGISDNYYSIEDKLNLLILE